MSPESCSCQKWYQIRSLIYTTSSNLQTQSSHLHVYADMIISSIRNNNQSWEFSRVLNPLGDLRVPSSGTLVTWTLLGTRAWFEPSPELAHLETSLEPTTYFNHLKKSRVIWTISGAHAWFKQSWDFTRLKTSLKFTRYLNHLGKPRVPSGWSWSWDVLLLFDFFSVDSLRWFAQINNSIEPLPSGISCFYVKFDMATPRNV